MAIKLNVENIQKALISSGIKKSLLAAKLGMHPASLSVMLHKNGTTKRATIEKMAEILGCVPEHLIEGGEDDSESVIEALPQEGPVSEILSVTTRLTKANQHRVLAYALELESDVKNNNSSPKSMAGQRAVEIISEAAKESQKNRASKERRGAG
jgi:DNA-binding Xre family transcriptional regulator